MGYPPPPPPPPPHPPRDCRTFQDENDPHDPEKVTLIVIGMDRPCKFARVTPRDGLALVAFARATPLQVIQSTSSKSKMGTEPWQGLWTCRGKDSSPLVLSRLSSTDCDALGIPSSAPAQTFLGSTARKDDLPFIQLVIIFSVTGN